MWPTLKNPPVVLAVFQLKYQAPKDFDIVKFSDAEKTSSLSAFFTKKNTNLNTHIMGFEGETPAPGLSSIKAKADTRTGTITYFTENQKKKIIIEPDSITFADETPYAGWEDFKREAIRAIGYFSGILSGFYIRRISIRFINKFVLESADSVLDYFNLTISSQKDGGTQYPITKYAFKYVTNTPGTNIYSVINQAIDPLEGKLIYVLDLDVLESANLLYDDSSISDTLDRLREVKNTIFFENITEKTIDLCNLPH